VTGDIQNLRLFALKKQSTMTGQNISPLLAAFCQGGFDGPISP
jgi:hypothetical protein